LPVISPLNYTAFPGTVQPFLEILFHEGWGPENRDYFINVRFSKKNFHKNPISMGKIVLRTPDLQE
jgi:hypothetical protein